MRSYLAPSRVPIVELVLLAGSSIILGIAIGVSAYFISSFIYYLVIFSLVIGGATMIAYYKLLQFTKVRHSILTALIGLITGLCVGLTYYGSEYLIVRHEFIKDGQKNYHVSVADASKAFDGILNEEVGSKGLWGYMKLRAKAGNQYTSYLIENGMPVHEFSFTLRSTWAWLYWSLELMLFSIPAAWGGYDFGKRAFNESAHDWYDPLPKQISTIPLESKEQLFASLKKGSLIEISELVVAEEKLSHPMIEIYEQHSNTKKGDVLLSVKQTFWDKNEKIRRNIIGQWEVSEQNYASFMQRIAYNLRVN